MTKNNAEHSRCGCGKCVCVCVGGDINPVHTVTRVLFIIVITSVIFSTVSSILYLNLQPFVRSWSLVHV